MFCVSYAAHQQQQNQHPQPIREEEEIYSSLKKVKRNEQQQQHITMIPLGSPHELRCEPTLNGTVIRVAAGPEQNQQLPELIPKMRQFSGSINNLSSHHENIVKKDFESWSGRIMEGRVAAQKSTTNSMRGYWERNIQQEKQAKIAEDRQNRPKSYGFPKWRSTDALSASLVASNSIQIPKDSRIPEERLRKMEETEREAIEVQREIDQNHNTNRRRLSKGKSLDSLNFAVENLNSNKKWYDAEQIAAAVSRESIANIATSREFFENGGANRGGRSRLSSISSMPQQNWEEPRKIHPTSAPPPPPLPPKSEAIQLRSQQFSTSSQDSPQCVDPIEQQEVLLMLYLKQNLDIVNGLGIRIPTEILQEMDDLQMLPVELRICDEEPPHRMFSPTMKNGRYQRKMQPIVNSSNRSNLQKYYSNQNQRKGDHFSNSNLDLASSTNSNYSNYGNSSSYAH
ncbi:unnamed protein product [Caenorhabditis angaria]|uniref:Uncharacterized protein n=1 Tax=Caenorhabditis angaria TaxID=860376 RepID=A0A9P1IB22_9PELO|nr:unnamed protein product [Caenorhabditis angaria]